MSHALIDAANMVAGSAIRSGLRTRDAGSRMPLLIAALGAAASLGTYAFYRREMKQIVAAVESGGTVVDTAAGPVEYAEAGEGEPMLLIHGAGGGYDQGLLVGRGFADAFRIIAPSRFGYLRTPVPQDASPSAQADAHAALLDCLAVDKAIVVGVSAGGPSAIEFALRYPGRTSALILLVPQTYHPAAAVGVDDHLPSQIVLRLVETSADFLFWFATKVARGAIVRFLGVPPALEAGAPAEERARVTALMRSILPLSRRVEGLAIDAAAEVGPWPLAEIRVPTLIVSAEDDLFNMLPGARYTAGHLPGAELKVLPEGGHLMVGKIEQVERWVGDFLGRSRASRSRTDG